MTRKALTDFLKHNVPDRFPTAMQLDGRLRSDPSEIIVKKLIWNMGKEFNYLKIIESSVLTPITVYRHFRGTNYVSLFLGYPRVNIQQKLQAVRQAAVDNSHCWSHQYSDSEMLQYIKHFKQLSNEIEQICRQLTLTFVDTSNNWQDCK